MVTDENQLCVNDWFKINLVISNSKNRTKYLNAGGYDANN